MKAENARSKLDESLERRLKQYLGKDGTIVVSILADGANQCFLEFYVDACNEILDSGRMDQWDDTLLPIRSKAELDLRLSILGF